MSSRITYQFCNNCGKQGHLYNQCKNPIISSGIVAFRKNTDTKTLEYLMICRKDSLGYIDFLRGKYPLYNKDYILTLINEMTNKEKRNLLITEFSELWRALWGDFVGLQYRGEERSAKDKFLQMKRGIKICDTEGYNLESLVHESDTSWDTPEWGFPKGRRNYQENDLTCGLREFEEETGYDKQSVSIIKNLLPFEEIFVGSNLKSYKHIYFLGRIESNTDILESYQKSEVSEMKWFSLDECKQYIRNYNIEKIDMICKINSLLEKYKLIT
jgi:8-oxo-dGTP pyrophosphatase MutT (NUDIX family)